MAGVCFVLHSVMPTGGMQAESTRAVRAASVLQPLHLCCMHMYTGLLLGVTTDVSQSLCTPVADNPPHPPFAPLPALLSFPLFCRCVPLEVALPPPVPLQQQLQGRGRPASSRLMFHGNTPCTQTVQFHTP